MVGQANKSAQELMDFPHVNQHSGPPVSLLSNEAKEKTVGGLMGGRAVGHLVFRGDSHWWQRDRRREKGMLKEASVLKSSLHTRTFGSHFQH